MDSIGNTSHFQQGDELCFPPLPPHYHQQPQQQHYILLPDIFLTSSTQNKLASTPKKDHLKDNDEKSTANKRKKIMHRDVERQRRHEMAMLYASLRFLLPLDYLKGKKSISDHMNEAANYIRHLQNKIRDLSEKRDRLRRYSFGASDHKESSGSVISRPTIHVHAFQTGVEVVVTTREEEGLPLSRVLELLMEEEVDPVTCGLVTVNHALIYTILCEVTEGKTVDSELLQQKLAQELNSDHQDLVNSVLSREYNVLIRSKAKGI